MSRTRRTSFGMQLDRVLDDAGEQQDMIAGDTGGLRILNNSRANTRPFSLYGRTSSGVVQLATQADSPLWLCLEEVPPGRLFKAATSGVYRVRLENRASSVTPGLAAFLAATAGTCAPAEPSSGKVWTVGSFASAIVNDGLALVDLNFQSAGIIDV